MPFRRQLRVHLHSLRNSLSDLGCMVSSAGRHAHAARAPLLPVAPCHVHVSAPGFSHRSAFQSLALRTLNSGACIWHVSSEAQRIATSSTHAVDSYVIFLLSLLSLFSLSLFPASRPHFFSLRPTSSLSVSVFPRSRCVVRPWWSGRAVRS